MRILLFDIDCLRPDHLGCYGYNRPTSPAIDRIAEESVLFTHYYCADSPCLPSRTGFASGRFGINNGVVSNHTSGAEFQIKKQHYGGPKQENEMLMRKLRSLGYETISFSNFADRHNAWYYMTGWSEFHTVNLKAGAETAEEINEKALHWLKSNAAKDNYLLHINYWDTHRCYKMDESWADSIKNIPVDIPFPDEVTIQAHQGIKGAFTATGQFKNNQSPFPLMPGAVRTREEFDQMVTAYDASIVYVNHYIQQILDELESQGVLDDTMIIFTSDHGDAFGEHGIYTDHVCADECIHHIPLIIRLPGVTNTKQFNDSLLYNVDLSATLCDVLGGTIPEEWDGISFANQLHGKKGTEREYLVWGHALYTIQRAVRTREHLFIRTYDDYGYTSFDPVALYAIKEDPFQTKNIAEDQLDKTYHMEHLLNTWLAEQREKSAYVNDPFDNVLKERKTRNESI